MCISVKESTLLKIALVVGLLGIAVLFMLSRQIKVDSVMISRLDGVEGEGVVVEGVVVGVNSGDGVVFLMLQKDEMLDVVLFGDVPSVEIGDYVQVRGTVATEDGGNSVLGEEVRVI